MGTTPGTATIGISGGEEVYTTSTGSLTFSGSEQSEVENGATVYDSGNLMVLINGMPYQVQYGEGSTVSSLASAFASGSSTCGSGGLFSATASGPTVYLSACQTGSSLIIEAYPDGSEFAQSSFEVQAGNLSQSQASVTSSQNPGGTVAGGFELLISYQDGPPDIVSLPAYNSTSTPSSIAASLVAALGSCSTGALVSGTQSGGTVYLTTCKAGASYPLTINNNCWCLC